MSDPTRIIVYRNPAEAAIWESGLVFPLIVAAGITFLTLILTIKLHSYLYFTRRWCWLSRDASIMLLISGTISFLTTIKFMGGL